MVMRWSGLAVVSLLLGAFPAWAQTSSEDLAVMASEVQVDYCAEIYGGNVDAAVEGYQVVASMWGELKTAYQTDPQPILLYWSGLMAQCLGQNDRAIEDLSTFLEVLEDQDKAGKSGTLWTMKKDAERRLDRMDVSLVSAPNTADLTVVSAAAMKKRRRTGAAMMVGGGATALVTFGVGAIVFATTDMDQGQDLYNKARNAEITMAVVGSVGAALGAVGLVVTLTRPSGKAALALTPGPVTTLSVSF